MSLLRPSLGETTLVLETEVPRAGLVCFLRLFLSERLKLYTVLPASFVGVCWVFLDDFIDFMLFTLSYHIIFGVA